MADHNKQNSDANNSNSSANSTSECNAQHLLVRKLTSMADENAKLHTYLALATALAILFAIAIGYWTITAKEDVRENIPSMAEEIEKLHTDLKQKMELADKWKKDLDALKVQNEELRNLLDVLRENVKVSDEGMLADKREKDKMSDSNSSDEEYIHVDENCAEIACSDQTSPIRSSIPTATLSPPKEIAFLTINGVASKHVANDGEVKKVWPFAGLISEGAILEVNFGQKPFKYNPWKHPLPE